MCDFEEFLFTCGHSEVRLKSHCHFARNDPYHDCFGVKVLRKSWRQDGPCEDCVAMITALEAANRQQGAGHGGPMMRSR